MSQAGARAPQAQSRLPTRGARVLPWTALAAPWIVLAVAATVRPDAAGLPFLTGWVSGCVNSLVVAGVAVCVALATGVPAGIGLTRAPRAWLVLAACLPILVPVYVLGLGWNALLTALPDGLSNWLGPNLLHTRFGAGATLGLWCSPLLAVALLGSHRRRDPQKAEAAAQLGGSRARLRVAASDHRAAVLGASAAVFALALVEPTVPYLYRLSNPGLEVHAGAIMHALATRHDALAAIVAAAPLTVIALAFLVACLASVPTNVTAAAEVRRMSEPRRAGVLRAWPLALALGVAAAPPLAALLLTALRGGQGSLTTLADMRSLALTSGVVAIAAAATALVPAILVGNAISRARGLRPKLSLFFLLLAPLTVPAGVPALGLLRLCNQPGLDWLYNGPAIVALSQALFIFPVMALLSWAALTRVPARLEEEARILGLSPLETFLQVRLREAMPGVQVAFGVGGLLAMAELPGTSVALPPGLVTLPFHVMQLAHWGTNHDLATASLTLAAAATAIAAATASAHALGTRHARRSA